MEDNRHRSSSVEWMRNLNAPEQQRVRCFLQEHTRENLREDRGAALRQRIRNGCRAIDRAVMQPVWRRLWQWPVLRPVGIGVACTALLLAYLLYAPAPESPVADTDPAVNSTPTAEVSFYLEEHALASGLKALDQGHMVTSIILHEL